MEPCLFVLYRYLNVPGSQKEYWHSPGEESPAVFTSIWKAFEAANNSGFITEDKDVSSVSVERIPII